MSTLMALRIFARTGGESQELLFPKQAGRANESSAIRWIDDRSKTPEEMNCQNASENTDPAGKELSRWIRENAPIYVIDNTSDYVVFGEISDRVLLHVNVKFMLENGFEVARPIYSNYSANRKLVDATGVIDRSVTRFRKFCESSSDLKELVGGTYMPAGID